ncbi:MAG: protein kinase [Pyrinomonadaceae bacterium]|nr:protein kinase [Pyrinomonadaceae bacterium]
MDFENKKLANYTIEKLLGKGGMGEVYLAKDERLGRRVALKILAEKYSQNMNRLSRFIQEAKAASALNHPNIITIYDIGEFESLHFIATEFIEGDTLHKRLKGKPLKVEDALEIAVQIASALDAAHRSGIVHRDIKPENIMIRPDGLVKILDFGIAKLTEKGSAEQESLKLVQTHPGMIMGTPQYMSPEQTRGIAIDERTDIWSLGIVLFQMVTGFVPFHGETTSDIIVAILERDVPPLVHFLTDFPAEIESFIIRALRKKTIDRYQSIAELAGDLHALKKKLEYQREFSRSESVEMLETIEMHAPPYLERQNTGSVSGAANKDKLLLTEFMNLTGEPIFDGTLRTALAVSLEQSPFLDIFPETQVRNTLRLMERSPDETVTAELGREICLRQGLKAYIAGTISSFGSLYVLTLEAVNAKTGESIARRLEQAGSKEEVLKFLANAASGLREKLGESLSSIEQFDAQFEYTTSSLDALKIYSLGVQQQRKGNWLQAISFYNQAITLDPEFSSAYVGASSSYSNTNQPKLAAEYAAKAFELRDKVSELEKLRISHFYYAYVTGELDKRIETLEIMRRVYPRVTTTLNNLADCYMQLGQFEKAIEACRKSLKEKPNSAVSYDNLAMSLMHSGKFDEARKVCETAVAEGIDNIYFHICLYQLAFLEDDDAAMNVQIDWMRRQPEEYFSFDLQARAAACAGRMKESETLSRRAVELARFNNISGAAGTFLAERALRHSLLNFEENDRFKAILTEIGEKALDFEQSPFVVSRVALAYATGTMSDKANQMLSALRKEFPKNTLVNQIWVPLIKAANLLAANEPQRAVEVLELVSQLENVADFFPQYLRGRAFLQLGENQRAAAEFEKILQNRGESPLSGIYPLALIGSAKATGDREFRDRFLILWRAADRDLKALGEAKDLVT